MSTPSEAENDKNPWNSLEVCKLVIGLAVPIAILIATNQFTAHQQKLSDDQAIREKREERASSKEDERERREVDRRFAVWEEMAPEMNQIYSYFLYVGKWKEIKPEEIIQKKRHLDELIYSNRIFFSDQFVASFTAFEEATFAQFQGWEHEPTLKTVRIRKQDFGSNVAFLKCDNADAVYQTFWDFQDASSDELKLPKVPKSPRPENKPTATEAPPCQGKQ